MSHAHQSGVNHPRSSSSACAMPAPHAPATPNRFFIPAGRLPMHPRYGGEDLRRSTSEPPAVVRARRQGIPTPVLTPLTPDIPRVRQLLPARRMPLVMLGWRRLAEGPTEVCRFRCLTALVRPVSRVCHDAHLVERWVICSQGSRALRERG